MKATWIIGLLLLSAFTVQGATFTVGEALLPDEPPQTNFTLDTFTRQYLRKSPKVAAQKNTLLNARATYQNAFAETFLPSFSVSATADKTYTRPDNIHS